jgi:acetylornithine/succinyldiaminopimelate/putrescine aminotransferase
MSTPIAPFVPDGRELLREPGPFISSDDVLQGRLDSRRAVQLEIDFGNADLIQAMQALDMAGPFRSVGPWELEDERGVSRINATCYAALPFGERHPELMEFVREYLAHNRNMGLPQQSASPWRAALQHNLISLLARFAPSHADSEILLSNSGAEAVEAAIKFVRGGRPNARYLINFTAAYHGLTWMALSLTPNHDYQDLFKPLLPDIVTLPFGKMEAVRDTVAGLQPENVAAIIVEPIQGEAGVIIPPPGFLSALGELCRAHGILVVADEIQTGLGRTGHWFESIAQGLEPDIITLAKPLGGGLVPIGATIARRGLWKRTLGGLSCGRNTSTFGGNSIAAAVALRSLEILVKHDLPARSASLGERGLARLRAIQARYPDLLEEVRGAGMLFALQFRPVVPPEKFRSHADLVRQVTSVLGLHLVHEAGVMANLSLGGKGTIRLTPPLNMPEALFDEMFERVERAASISPSAWQMLVHTKLHTLVNLATLASRT